MSLIENGHREKVEKRTGKRLCQPKRTSRKKNHTGPAYRFSASTSKAFQVASRISFACASTKSYRPRIDRIFILFLLPFFERHTLTQGSAAVIA